MPAKVWSEIQSQAKSKCRLTKVAVGAQNIKFDPKWGENRWLGLNFDPNKILRALRTTFGLENPAKYRPNSRSATRGRPVSGIWALLGRCTGPIMFWKPDRASWGSPRRPDVPDRRGSCLMQVHIVPNRGLAWLKSAKSRPTFNQQLAQGWSQVGLKSA